MSRVREIWNEAFSDCKQLKTVRFAKDSQLEELKACCFYGSGIKSIVLPQRVRAIGYSAFQDCTWLRSARLNEGLEEINGCGVFGGSGLRNVELPSTLRDLGNCTFSACGALRYIRLPEGLERVGNACF